MSVTLTCYECGMLQVLDAVIEIVPLGDGTGRFRCKLCHLARDADLQVIREALDSPGALSGREGVEALRALARRVLALDRRGR